ncbi:MAG: UvrD-helicase domain-containing protein [Defluviitaleaceae bacterium]|nr:UvrD-helicase domain-containing protein [Defluviitaleaceae bacterium]
MSDPTHPDYPQELTYLNTVLAYLAAEIPTIKKQKDELDGRVSYAFAHMNIDNPEQFSELTVSLSLLDGWKTLTRQMEYAQRIPYFARVDFNSATHYIGKMTLLRGLEVLITDWRAPLATLYYEGRIGQAAYDCPDGHITGDLTLKRQYQIDAGELKGFTDIDVTASDTFLQAALGASRDRRLRDIVTTIQAEQNRIIRHPLRSPLLVQGAAGSGKTTIALHRIAYLLYNHTDTLAPRHVTIFAPSRFFLSYISDVLPELGVDQVTQTTFADFAAECLELDGKKHPIASPLEALTEAINSGKYMTHRMKAAGYKGTLAFHRIIKNYLRHIEEGLLPEEDFGLEGYTLFSRDRIARMFTETYTFLPTDKRPPEIEKYLTNTLKRQIPRIERNIEAVFDKHMAKIKALMPEDSPARRRRFTQVIAKRDAMLKQLHEKARPTRKKYMRTFKLKSALTYYRLLFSTPGLLTEMAEGIYDESECETLTNEARLAFARNSLEPEDLPPLLCMHKHLFGMKNEMKHVVIDEAQDYSPFQFLALKEAFPHASFSVMGDVHQGLLAHKGINDWGEIEEIFDVTPLILSQSYRTTIEIMEAANPVILRLYPEGTSPSIPLAVPVIRHGEAVRRHTVYNLNEDVTCIENEIAAARGAGCRSIAIIAKSEKECKELQALLSDGENPYPIVTEQETDYEGGVLILPVYLAKGLEFDAVIIADASRYTSQPLDIKLLYIAMTRALHRLAIVAKERENGYKPVAGK